MRKDDTQLIVEYLDGDEAALGVLVERYLKDVYNFAYKLTNDLQAAEDITQESFVKAWKNIRKYRHESVFRTWIFSIARNTAIDWLRRKRDVPFSSFENERGENTFVAGLVDTHPMPDELLEQAENVRVVQDILLRLGPHYRDVLDLRYTGNLTFEEIGVILHKPLHTVKSQHRRALIALQRTIKVRVA